MEGEEEREEEIETNEDALKAQIAIRCAKAAFLLESLKSPRVHTAEDIDEERARLLRFAADLRMELVKERLKNRNMSLCSLAEVILQILVLLSFATFCLILVKGSI